MTDFQAVRLPAEHAAQLGPLRTARGLDVCEDAGGVWLRVRESSDDLYAALRSLPNGETFEVLPDGQLRRTGSRVPAGSLPNGDWRNVAEWMQVALPPAQFAARIGDGVSLRLVRDSRFREPNMLLTSVEVWTTYGVRAPQIRLNCWSFAVSTEGKALIRGLPLPPVPGTRLVEESGIAVPCGLHWSPAVDADVVARAMSVSPGELLLWKDDGSAERIAADQFVRATRSAIRLSAGAVAQ